MKKIIFLICSALIVSLTSVAQDQPREKKNQKTAEERAEIRTQRLTNELGLNSEQQIKTKELLLKREREKDQEGKNRRAAKKQNHKEMKDEFKTFLTAEQYKKMEQKQRENRVRRQERKKDANQNPNTRKNRGSQN